MNTRTLVRDTAINDLGDDRYEVIEPIKIRVSEEDGKFIAQTTEIGIVIDGYGNTEEEAIADLREMIVAQQMHMDETDPSVELGDFAVYQAESFRKCIRKK